MIFSKMPRFFKCYLFIVFKLLLYYFLMPLNNYYFKIGRNHQKVLTIYVVLFANEYIFFKIILFKKIMNSWLFSDID